MAEEITPDPQYLIKLIRTKMPFGKYQGRSLIDLPNLTLYGLQERVFQKMTLEIC